MLAMPIIGHATGMPTAMWWGHRIIGIESSHTKTPARIYRAGVLFWLRSEACVELLAANETEIFSNTTGAMVSSILLYSSSAPVVAV